MLRIVSFDKFNPPENAFVFSASALNIYTKSRYPRYCEKILEDIEDGKIKAVVTALELAKLKKYVGEAKYYKTYNPVWRSQNSEVFCIREINFDSPFYKPLYTLYINRNIHASDLSSVIASIEYAIPLITDDDHHWRLQQNFIKTYKKRHAEAISQALIKKEKPKCFEMYTSQDFCKMFPKSYFP